MKINFEFDTEKDDLKDCLETLEEVKKLFLGTKIESGTKTEESHDVAEEWLSDGESEEIEVTNVKSGILNLLTKQTYSTITDLAERLSCAKTTVQMKLSELRSENKISSTTGRPKKFFLKGNNPDYKKAFSEI